MLISQLSFSILFFFSPYSLKSQPVWPPPIHIECGGRRQHQRCPRREQTRSRWSWVGGGKHYALSRDVRYFSKGMLEFCSTGLLRFPTLWILRKTCFNYFSRLCLKKWNWRGYTESDEGTQNLTSAQPFWHSLSLQYQLWHYVKVKGIPRGESPLWPSWYSL